MMATVQRVEQETGTSKNLANVENMIDATGNRLRLKDGERLHPTSLGNVDPRHEAGKCIQQITKVTLRVTEAWTHGRHASNDKYVELDCELAVALANVTEVAARSPVLKVTHVAPSHGFVAWPALGTRPSHRTTQLQRCSPYLPPPKRCKDAQDLKEKLKAWSLKVAEYERQFKVIDEAQKTFVVMEMMPKDIKREFLTGLGRLDEIMDKLEITINEMMAHDGPVAMDLVNVGTYDAKRTLSDSDTSNDMSHEDVCNRLEKVPSRQGNGQERIKRTGGGGVHQGSGADELASGKADDPRAATLMGTVTKTKDPMGTKAQGKGKSKGKSETRY